MRRCPLEARAGTWALLAAAMALAAWVPPLTAQTARPTCESCHGELELLRQHVRTLEDAEALLAPAASLARSAHGEMTCTSCHEGFGRYPHAAGARTRGCASCHEEASRSWGTGMHALDSAATCTACHGTHEVEPLEKMRTAEGARAMRATCSGCHYDAAAVGTDPHADSVSCAGCHEPHATLPSEDEHASTHVLNQALTCGTCHDTVAAAWMADVHGRTAPALSTPGGPVPQGASRAEPPSCTGCHGAHGMIVPGERGFGLAMSQRCSHCHEHYAESFSDSYHGQAATLGSEIVATCHDCHGSHDILPSSDPESLVGEERRLETCRTCHEQATAGFALFQPHADHGDRERYPYVYWSYHLMTALLIGTFTLFGIHTVLWLARLALDALRGTPHGTHHDGGGGA